MFDGVFFNDILTSNNILYKVISCNLSFIFDCPIICKTVKCIDQSDTSSQCVLSFQYFKV